MPAIQLSELKLDKNLVVNDQAAVCELLRKYGVLTVPGMYDADSMKKLNDEYDRLLNSTESFVRKIDYSTGRAVSVQLTALDKQKYPQSDTVFHAPYFQKITSMYLGLSEIIANQSMYVVNDIVGTRHHANDLHFDVQRSLKFFIYLTDTTAENGAFACVPGSHKATQEIRVREGRKINYDNREMSRELPVNENDAIPIEGPAGTLIIFDTDVFHRTGFVSKGERRVMRGQSSFSDKLNYPGESGKGKSFFSKLFG